MGLSAVFARLVKETILLAGQEKLAVDNFCGTALFDSKKDDVVQRLPSFLKATKELSKHQHFSRSIGDDNACRVAIQFVYEYFKRVRSFEYKESVLNAISSALLDELTRPQWRSFGIGNLLHFEAVGSLIEIGDGIVLCERNPKALRNLGVAEWMITRIFEEWFGWGASSWVIIVKASFDKAPNNLTSVENGAIQSKLRLVITAARLLAPGSIGVDKVWITRISEFDFGLLRGIGFEFGSRSARPVYTWSDDVRVSISSMYKALKIFDENGYPVKSEGTGVSALLIPIDA